jgi:hypothetical protein
MMPSSSKKQADFMRAVAHSPSFAKKVGVPQSVGKDFSTADKGRKFSKGGDMKKMNMGGYADGGMPMVNKGGKMVPEFAADGKGKMAKGGMTKMAKGGMAKEDMKQDKAMMQKAVNKHEGRLHKGSPMTKLAGGGTFRASANGIAQKGKTKGTQIAMKNGGKC